MRISDWSSDVCSSDLRALSDAKQRVHTELPHLLLAQHLDLDAEPLQTFRLLGEACRVEHVRSEEHTSELQSLMRISYAVFCLKKKKKLNKNIDTNSDTYDRNNKQRTAN